MGTINHHNCFYCKWNATLFLSTATIFISCAFCHKRNIFNALGEMDWQYAGIESKRFEKCFIKGCESKEGSLMNQYIRIPSGDNENFIDKWRQNYISSLRMFFVRKMLIWLSQLSATCNIKLFQISVPYNSFSGSQSVFSNEN